MNTIEFFNKNFGQHLVEQTGNPVADAAKCLSGGHQMAKGGGQQRIASGWAIVTDKGSTLQFKLAATGITYSEQTRYEAWLEALTNFKAGDQLMLLEFDKKPVPVANLARTVDLRHVVICGPKGNQVFDWTQEPTKESCAAHKVMWKMAKNAAATTT